MYKIFLKIFMWYSRKLGYSIVITKENLTSYEIYTSEEFSYTSKEKLEVPVCKSDPEKAHIEIKKPLDKFNFLHTNEKISYLDPKKVEQAGGIAILMSKKINELINAINLINHGNQKNPE